MRSGLLRGSGVRVGRGRISLLTSRDLLRGVGVGRVGRCGCVFGGFFLSRRSLEWRLGVILKSIGQTRLEMSSYGNTYLCLLLGLELASRPVVTALLEIMVMRELAFDLFLHASKLGAHSLNANQSDFIHSR